MSRALSQYHIGNNHAVGPLSSATCPSIFMQLTGQNNDGTAISAFLLSRNGI